MTARRDDVARSDATSGDRSAMSRRRGPGWLRRWGRRSAPAEAGPAAPEPAPSAPEHTGCFAPSMQLHFKPNGDVLPCCWSIAPLGRIGEQRLPEIWDGAARAALVARLRSDDFSAGCQVCEGELAVEGRAGSHVEYFDEWRDRLGNPPEGRLTLPRRFEFELSNACNLQCQQCTGDYSSSIRIHREKRPPMPRVYDDQFFEDLVPFLPGLVDVSFAGGEPYMAPENYRIWDLLAELNPGVATTIITNGTHWNERVERVLDRLQVDTAVSIDGFSAEVYESIRIGSSHATVMRNLERFRAYARERGRRMQVNFCLMPQNVHELADMVLFAEERDMDIFVNPVRGPAHCSLTSLGPAELARIVAATEARADEVERSVVRNRAAWDHALAAMRAWRDSGAAPVRVRTNPRILMFDREGTGPHDDREAVAELRARTGSPVWTVVISSDDHISSFPPELAARLGADVTSFVGEHPSALLGYLRRWEQTAELTDRVDASWEFDSGRALGAMVAIRDERGTCERVHLLVSFLG